MLPSFNIFKRKLLLAILALKVLARKNLTNLNGKSVFEVYEDASVPFDLTAEKKAADDAGIDFFTSPYSLELVDKLILLFVRLRLDQVINMA